MRGKKIILCSILAVFLLVMLPNISAVQYKTVEETNKKILNEKIQTKIVELKQKITSFYKNIKNEKPDAEVLGIISTILGLIGKIYGFIIGIIGSLVTGVFSAVVGIIGGIIKALLGGGLIISKIVDVIATVITSLFSTIINIIKIIITP